jgi:glycosyltransferase involved in cell wall biosynthesis
MVQSINTPGILKLIIFVDWFFPGFKAGGQISSCMNIVEAMDEDMQIYIVTRNTDLGETQCYPGIVSDTWTGFKNYKNVQVKYLSKGKAVYDNFEKIIAAIQPDTVYFNSMFSLRFTILPLLVIKNLRIACKIVLAPRGMLQDGALQFKAFKKKLLLRLLCYLGIVKNLMFHATDETEVADIRKNIAGKYTIKLVYDFPAAKQDKLVFVDKQPGQLRCLFVSRISRKKNLLFVLQLMAVSDVNIDLTIAGPVEDHEYWKQCRTAMAVLGKNCNINWIGPVPKEDLNILYQQHHLLVLPTFGENFGHVIFDSFKNGRPVIISTNTPWRRLESHQAGFDIDLSNQAAFVDALKHYAAMDTTAYRKASMAAWTFGKIHIEKTRELAIQYKSLFSR